MKVKKVILSVFSILVMSSIFAQANILNATSPDEIGVKTELQKLIDNDQPLEYGYVDDRDIFFSKMVWEEIPLDERINFPLYFPVDTNNIGKQRRSLYDVLIKNIKNGEIENIYDDSYFNTKRTLKDIKDALTKIDTLEAGYEQLNSEGYVDEEYILEKNITSYNITSFLIKGLWYFDKRQGELKYRLLGIAPAAPDVNFIDSDDEANREPIPLFWVFFPDARQVLHEAMAFNGKNSSKPFSFDHILNSRRFSSYIYKEENIRGDISVTDYILDNSLMQLLESDRIKEKIRNFELDMWSY